MNTVKILLVIFVISFLNANEIIPTKTLNISAGATDLVINNDKLFVSTSAGIINIFNLKDFKLISNITIPQIKNFMGEVINSKIYSIDVLNNKVLILSQGKKGARKIDIFENGKIRNIISDEKQLFIARAKFINDEKIVLSLLSNELLLYNVNKKKIIYDKQISQSRFSYFALSENKKEILIADESGNLKLCDVKTGDLLKTYKGQNLDNVFQVDFKNEKIITAGQDRRAVFYSKNDTYYKESNFLIYSCALNSKGTLAAYSSNENNDVTIFDTSSRKDLHLLKENKMTLTKILFIKDNEVLVASDDNKINYYKIKE
ncbi:putative periplasmic protein [Arcobacter nitrofigilis DSM 7299]|uniref:Putative periplasmic protein n=1 Tax=Arcobacter nitrofigilis (strain ATCC 33309 / DSM 7299 / CCUG 15893 / LMG 7604 / NCTC 12251 / CI) TaxID=572480 RepID=D5UZL1_ARCNC|nr:WD40 repeat domain-containing protein [Arcobacter nitrofigilis]ADG92248.1 putative periplasmic protein [Arcobacter nitrofigilis DSM 7299]